MTQCYYFDKHGAKLLEDFWEALDQMHTATEQLAQYVADEHDRDRYKFLHEVAHCQDYFSLARYISECFSSLNEEDQCKYFKI